MRNRFRSASISLLALLAWRGALASPEFVPLQEMAQGHSLAGSSQLNDSLYTNPASSAFTQVYAIDGALLMPKAFAISILDTKTSTVGGALGYFRRPFGDSAQPMQGLKLGLSGRVSEVVGVGAAGKMIWGPQINGESLKHNDLDTGMLFNLGITQFGVTMRNMLGGDPGLALNREFSLGGRIGYLETLYLSIATTSKWETPKPYEYGIGAEYVSPYYFSLKAGYRIQPETNSSYWSGGLSFLTPKISFHYGVQFPQQSSEKTEHILGTTLLF